MFHTTSNDFLCLHQGFICQNPDNPFHVAEDETLSELAESIKEFGIVTPIITRPKDAGREGELIFRLVYYQAGCKKPFKRLWISSMEDEAIKEGFDNLREGSDYDNLYEAALCRSKADWLVGINGTRLCG